MKFTPRVSAGFFIYIMPFDMTTEFVKVSSPNDITELAVLAGSIWHEYFVRIISVEQIDYMVEKFQSAGAIASQLRDGYEYYFIRTGGMDAGYIGIYPEIDGRLFLSKLYIAGEYRGRGLSSAAFDFMENLCRERGLKAIWLTVNRHNDHTVAVYRHRGFRVTEEKATDIGRGFVMDDFIMELPVVK